MRRSDGRIVHQVRLCVLVPECLVENGWSQRAVIRMQMKSSFQRRAATASYVQVGLMCMKKEANASEVVLFLDHILCR